MIAYMEGLSLTEADNLKKTISKLFRQTCIVQMRYDPVTLVPRDNPDYEICVRPVSYTHLPVKWVKGSNIPVKTCNDWKRCIPDQ